MHSVDADPEQSRTSATVANGVVLQRFKADTNLIDLPWSTVRQLDQYLDFGLAQKKLHAELLKTDPNNFNETLALMSTSSSAAEKLLQVLGKRGKCVADLLVLCDKVRLLEPQLVLHRKFEAVQLTKQPQVIEANAECLVIACTASGFPYPVYQWYCNSVPLDGQVDNVLMLRTDEVLDNSAYHCVVSNRIPCNEAWSGFYDRKNKPCTSSCTSDLLRPALFVASWPSLSTRVPSSQQLISKPLNGSSSDEMPIPSSADHSKSTAASVVVDDDVAEQLVALDKVALIVSNSEYLHMAKLITPPRDATVLAENLIQLGFKTVTLSDLTLADLKMVINEYCALLGTGVYAVLYFVGHGFEANGQSYLMPIDAPEVLTSFDQCLCTEEVLYMMQETNQAMSLILLDICRRLDINEATIGGFVRYKPRVNRNTVIGYATSFGECSYEVLGDDNGVFMKYLIRYLQSPKPVTAILTSVMRDLENDIQANRIQFPEIRTTMSKRRSLADPLIFSGHTATYDQRTYRWQQLHELPEPMKIEFNVVGAVVLIWFDFYGYFSNAVIVCSTVLPLEDEKTDTATIDCSKTYLSILKVPQMFDSTYDVVKLGESEQTIVKTVVKNLQRLRGPVDVLLQLIHQAERRVVCERSIQLADILISKLNA